MRESIGNSLLMNLVIIFSGIVILFFIGVITYSKAYRVKNRIIEIVEKYGDYDNADAQNEINESLNKAGYSIVSKSNRDYGRIFNHLEEIGVSSITTKADAEDKDKNGTDYNYCIYEVTNKSSDGSKYYIVATFVHFDFPLIGNFINIPVYGETKILGKTYDY